MIFWSYCCYYLIKVINDVLKDVFCCEVDRYCGVVKFLIVDGMEGVYCLF